MRTPAVVAAASPVSRARPENATAALGLAVPTAAPWPSRRWPRGQPGVPLPPRRANEGDTSTRERRGPGPPSSPPCPRPRRRGRGVEGSSPARSPSSAAASPWHPARPSAGRHGRRTVRPQPVREAWSTGARWLEHRGRRAVRHRPGAQRRRRRCSRELPLRHWRPLGLDGHGPPRRGWRAGGEDGGQVRRLERLPPGLDRRQTGSQPGLGSVPFRRPGSRRRTRVRKHAGGHRRRGARPGSPSGRRSASSTATFCHRQRAAGQRPTERDSETVESRGPRVPEMPEQQVSLQELESELDRYIHDVENGATVVVSRDGRQVARIIPETDSAEQKRAALKASGTFDWSGRRPKSRRPSVRLRDGGSVSDIIISERR